MQTVVSASAKPAFRQLIRSLPGMLGGSAADSFNVARGFSIRIGFSLLERIVDNFEVLSRGGVGIDGTKWPPLSPAYLAYKRRFAPGEREALLAAAGISADLKSEKGILTPEQIKLWRRVFARYLARFLARGDKEEEAKSHAAAIAWIAVKEAGGKTKLEVFGKRVVQILVDTGRGRSSLLPGYVIENGPAAEYIKVGASMSDQVFDMRPGSITVGTNIKYMAYHHYGRNVRKRRRLWPEKMPAEWFRHILRAGLSGLVRIGELFGGRPA